MIGYCQHLSFANTVKIMQAQNMKFNRVWHLLPVSEYVPPYNILLHAPNPPKTSWCFKTIWQQCNLYDCFHGVWSPSLLSFIHQYLIIWYHLLQGNVLIITHGPKSVCNTNLLNRVAVVLNCYNNLPIITITPMSLWLIWQTTVYKQCRLQEFLSVGYGNNLQVVCTGNLSQMSI